MAHEKITTAKKKLFVYSDFEEAKDRFLKAVAAGPFYGLLTGPSGSGKTMLLRELSSSIDRHRSQAHYLSLSQTSRSGIARFFAEILHLSPWCSPTVLLRAVAQTLKALPVRIVLLLDDAHSLGAEALGEVRILAECELDSPPLFSVVFSGTAELKAKLETPALFPLKRRITLRAELSGLKGDEAGPFLSSRLGESEASRLGADGISAIFERANGIPALIESFAKLSLEGAPEGKAVSMEALQDTLDAWSVS